MANVYDRLQIDDACLDKVAGGEYNGQMIYVDATGEYYYDENNNKVYLTEEEKKRIVIPITGKDVNNNPTSY